MSLTDLEICKKIAEIEGKKGIIVRSLGDGKNHVTVRFAEGSGYIKCVSYNPLTDDALCFQLMVKHKVVAAWLWDELDGTSHYDASVCNGNIDNESFQDTSPNKAICLAIIKANNS